MNTFLQAFPIFLLIFCRITSFFVVAPVFSTRGVPTMFKVGLGFFLSVIVYLSYGSSQAAVPADATYLLLVGREILVGLLIGFTCYLFFTVVQTAGAFIDLQMGLAMANVYDPMTGASAPITGNFKFYVMVLIFLGMNGHHFLLDGIVQSYDWIPIDNGLFTQMAAGTITQFLTKALVITFMLALQISAPLVVALFLTDVGLGFLAKTAPQFNVFVIGMPLKILIGLLLLALVVPGLTGLFAHLFSQMFNAMGELMAIVNGSAAR
ncbi:flagellar biosynthetic protein FliR [Paenibacillus sambharensis]|uniref:Flagellar biosynthetic protein FliR n=1 Tax=Paenibacillus sambharensis TaxID=1803190 RepID=A0A2W1L065_9BACL|nr:flagellar biosynthetic protein FliR [Paenibacillus sambharensis]PZD93338.1 flagellar biosynthetic protein FliR [Paenibacillus sambharensis]